MRPPTSVQPDLFSVAPAGPDRSFAQARRVSLDAGSWIEHVPAWLAGSEELFAQLLADAGWEQRTRRMYDQQVLEPRLTAQYPDIARVPYPQLIDVAEALGAHYGATYDRLWINLYRDHHDSTGWHGDAVGRRAAESTVPVLSLGAARRFLIKPAVGGRSVGFTVSAGDLLVMGGRAQRDWRHCVPKQGTPAGPRISVNFAPRAAPEGSAPAR